MNLISSDTNVWIDFEELDRLDLPFKLDYVYLMCSLTIEEELKSVELQGLKERGLISVELTEEEFLLVQEYGTKYFQLSFCDRIALAIAKNRKILLLTGDLALRKAAMRENVKIIGTLKILDELKEREIISVQEYITLLKIIEENRCGKFRLPQNEIQKRINMSLPCL